MVAVDVISLKGCHSYETKSQICMFKFWTNVNSSVFLKLRILKCICKFRLVFLNIFLLSQKFTKHFCLSIFIICYSLISLLVVLLGNSIIIPWIYIFKYFAKFNNSEWSFKRRSVKTLYWSLPWNQADARNYF